MTDSPWEVQMKAGVAWEVSDTEGPWEIRWEWNTGYRGIDRLPTRERVMVFLDEMFKRVEPPRLEVARLSVINVETGERIAAPGKHVVSPPRKWPLQSGMRWCGTCDGVGEILIVQTDRWLPCTRCDGSGQEPHRH